MEQKIDRSRRSTSPAAALKGRPKPTARRAPSGERVRAKILFATQQVLSTKGHAALTTRAVAAAAGIAPGHLGYHYRTKRELFRALIATLVKHYEEELEALFVAMASHPKDGFAAMVAWLINDSLNKPTARLFRELWVMALHDKVIARAMEDFYGRALRRAAQLLRQSQPHVDEARALEVAWLVGLICEGANPIYGTNPRKGAPVEKVIALAITALSKVTESAGAGWQVEDGALQVDSAVRHL